MADPTSTPDSADTPEPRPTDEPPARRRQTLGEAVVAALPPERIAAAAAPVDRALASIAAAVQPSLAPLAARAVSNLLRVSYHRPAKRTRRPWESADGSTETNGPSVSARAYPLLGGL